MRWQRLSIAVICVFAAWCQEAEKEIALGRGLAEDFRAGNRILDDEPLRSYLNELAARVNQAAQIPYPLSLELSADADPKARATAFPGGHIFVPVGLLLTAADEAALAGELAHAFAHARQRSLQLRQATALVVMPGWHQHTESLLPLSMREAFRQQEAEADRLAAQWLSVAGPFDDAKFGAMQQRAGALAPPPKQPPTLRRKQ